MKSICDYMNFVYFADWQNFYFILVDLKEYSLKKTDFFNLFCKENRMHLTTSKVNQFYFPSRK